MLCANPQRALLAITFLATLLSASTASAQLSWKLYDLRDLIGLLPQDPQIETAGSKTSAPFFRGAAQVAPRPDSVDELMDTICGGLGLNHMVLSVGIYGIEAEKVEHNTLLSMLEKVRELYAERYEIQIVWYSASPSEAPTIGDLVTPTEPLHRHHLVVARRAPTEIAQVTQRAYVSNIQPVVASGAVGYGLDVRWEESGLRASIMVGAGDEEETATSIQLRGDLRRVAMGKMTGSLQSDQERSMEVELPEVSMRSIRSRIRIEYGKLTALAVVDGFDDEGSIVVAASVRRLDD